MNKRFFLNDNHGLAAMNIDVKDGVEGKRYLDADVTLTDCGRQVALEFGCEAKSRAARLRKVRRIIAAFQEVERAIANYKFGKGDRDYL